MDGQTIWNRVMAAVKLQPGVYGEIGNDQQATGQAIAVVIAAQLVGGLGALWPGGVRFRFFGWIFGAVIGGIIGLAIVAGVLYLVSRLFNARGTYVQLFRSAGFAFAPGALGIVPVVGTFVGWIWSLVLAIRAVKETQEVSDGKAVAIVLIPAAIALVLFLILAVLLSIAFLGFLRSSG